MVLLKNFSSPLIPCMKSRRMEASRLRLRISKTRRRENLPARQSSSPSLPAIPEGESGINVPDYVAVQEETAMSVDAEPFFAEDFGQTEYVEKDSVLEASNAVSAGPLVPLEVVHESPSLSLVRTAKEGHTIEGVGRIMAEIVAIALPALGTVLADPLMSLVDTACVGQISAIQLAALGPNTSIFNMIFAMLGVLGAALANRLATNSLKVPGLSRKERRARKEQNERILSHTLQVAAGLGVAVIATMFAFGRPLLSLLGTSPAVMKPALDYLLIRSLATPAVLVIAAAQGACLGQQDMWTPMKVALTAGVINLVGDVVLTMGLKMGTVGAAAATVAAQVAGAAFFLRYLRKGGSDGKAVKLKWKGLPTYASMKPIIDMGRVLVTRSLVIMITYCGMTAVATSSGTITLAAHQVALQFFWFLSFVPEPLSLTAQSLIARDKNNGEKIRELSRVLVKFGALAGAGLSVVFGITLAFLARCFTSDQMVIAAFQKVIPHGMAALFLCCTSSMFDGVCIGMNQLKHISGIVYASTAATMGYLWASQKLSMGLSGIWVAMVIFFASRNLLHVAHLAKNWRLSPYGGCIATNRSMEVQLASA